MIIPLGQTLGLEAHRLSNARWRWKPILKKGAGVAWLYWGYLAVGWPACRGTSVSTLIGTHERAVHSCS